MCNNVRVCLRVMEWFVLHVAGALLPPSGNLGFRPRVGCRACERRARRPDAAKGDQLVPIGPYWFQ
jgi:hypothetical protein